MMTSCVNISKQKSFPTTFSSVKITPVLQTDYSIRALYVDQQILFFSGSKGKFGYLNTADNSVAHIGTVSTSKGTSLDFRALAHTPTANYILSAGNPALLYRVNNFGKRKLLFKQDTTGTFYDAMAFWNSEEGLMVGDPIEGCIQIKITRDGGKTWQAVDCSQLVPAFSGEAAFAASNTNIAIKDDKTWVVTGGQKTRVYYSPDKGESWQIYNTPIIGGKNTTGGYSIDFYNDKLGVIFGGDYTNPKGNHANKAITKNGGKTWQLIADNKAPGYKSCVKFIPGSNGQELVAVGITGISYSSDSGKSWVKLSDEPFYTFRFLNSFTAYAAGKGRIVKLNFIENIPNQAHLVD